jgi:DNA-binding HxlR family transcriptional regulator
LPGLWPKGVKEILEYLEKSPRRFNQLATVKVGSSRINRRTLANRLPVLEGEGLIERTIKEARPPYALYSITKLGKSALRFLREAHVR